MEDKPKWTSMSAEQQVKHILSKSLPADCTFVVKDDLDDKDVKFRCHKEILAASSEVFQAMFCKDFKESNQSVEDEIHITDTNAAAFKQFIDYIYFQKTHPLEYVGLKILLDLIFLCNKYMIDNLSSKCIDTIDAASNRYADEDIIKIFECAHMIDNEDLFNITTDEIKRRPKSIVQVPIINDLSVVLFYELLEVLKDIATEERRFTLVENYIKAHELDKNIYKKETDRKTTENSIDVSENEPPSSEETKTSGNEEKVELEEVKEESAKTFDYGCNDLKLTALLRCIDFTEMTLEGFINGPGHSQYISFKEKFNILSELCMKSSKKARKKEDLSAKPGFYC